MLLLAIVACTSAREARLPLESAELCELNAQVQNRELTIVAAIPPRDAGTIYQPMIVDRESWRGRDLVLDVSAAAFTDVETGKRRTVPTAALRRISWPSDGHPGSFGGLQGAAIGLVSGVAIGALAGFASGDDPPCTSSGWFCFRYSAGFKAEVGAAGLGVIGLLVGAFVGSAIGHHDAIHFAPMTPDKGDDALP
ncbi:MAG TPA: hypothetical protein VLW85_21830 [Myxococcales bacterium]|nr:hypothetical protein [Myxococcales bacterium]